MLDTATPIENVVSLDNARDLAAAENGVFFPIQEKALSDLTGMPDNGLKAVVRTDTNQLLAVNGRRYKLVPNQTAFGIVDEAIRKASGLNTEGMKIEDKTAYSGGTCVRDYIFPEHKAEVSVGDVTEMRITVVNSYDGSSGFKAMVGGFRLICSNGMVAGKVLDRYRARHTSGLNLGDMSKRIDRGITSFNQLAAKWKGWVDTPVDTLDAYAYIDKLKVSDPLKDQIKLYWHVEEAKLGANKWALYNALTYYSTHHRISRGRGNEAVTVLNREAEVSKVVTLLEAA